jgi:DNA segregation ATPase FtsK/SpoIIIE-like protein
MEFLSLPVIIVGGLAGVIGWGCFGMKRENKLFRTLDLKNKEGKFPHLLDRDETPRVKTYVFWLPDGISMELFTDPKSRIYQAIRQSLGDMHRIDLVPIDGHKIAVRVIKEELKSRYDYEPGPADKKDPLTFAIGESLEGPVAFSLGNTVPHICIAGSAGSGKSVCLRGMITSLILHQKKVSLWLIDMKGGTEFQVFQRCSRVSGYAKSVPEGLEILKQLQGEMIRRNDLFFAEGVNSIDTYNAAHPKEQLKRHVLFVDEFAEFMAGKDRTAKDILKDLARRARSSGIHMVIATQRPDSDVLDGQIRANMPGYLCFMVASTTNSTLILGHGGAQQLPGNGRGIMRVPARKETEFQGYYLGEEECKALVQHTYVNKQPAEEKKAVGSQWQSCNGTGKP